LNETSTDSAWREVAWNGVRFEAPAAWVPASIGPRYLLFEDRSGPTLEIRWEPVRGKFSHAAQLKRLSAGRGRKPSRPAAAVDLPASWAAALNRFEAAGFSWCGERLGAQGAILYCPACRQASLIQLFRQGKGLRRRDAERILASLRDHVDGEWVPWALFDIRAQVPREFRLKRHRFAAGRFELLFDSGGRRLCLHRWAPAATLLESGDFEEFARRRIGFPGGDPVARTWRCLPAVEWEIAPPATGRHWWWARFKTKFPYRWLRLWHLEDHNRILGVRMESRRPISPDLLDWVCEAYEVV
jgi:hypothetical protein